MIPFGKGYFIHEGKVYKELKPSMVRKVPRYLLTNKQGKRQWITQSQIQEIIDNYNKK